MVKMLLTVKLEMLFGCQTSAVSHFQTCFASSILLNPHMSNKTAISSVIFQFWEDDVLPQ